MRVVGKYCFALGDNLSRRFFAYALNDSMGWVLNKGISASPKRILFHLLMEDFIHAVNFTRQGRISLHSRVSILTMARENGIII